MAFISLYPQSFNKDEINSLYLLSRGSSSSFLFLRLNLKLDLIDFHSTNHNQSFIIV